MFFQVMLKNNMIMIVLSVLLASRLASGGSTQLGEVGEVEYCDAKQLDVCVKSVPRTPVGLPRTKEQLDANCFAFRTGMTCMDAWIKRCLPGDGQKIIQRQIGGTRAVMRFLCTNETALRKDYLKESLCWSRVSPGWMQCVDELNDDVREISERTQELVYYSKNPDLCCVRDMFLMCVADAGRVCSSSGSALLKRMSFVLAQDVAVCSPQHKAYCAAPPPPVTAPLLLALYSTLLYSLFYHIRL